MALENSNSVTVEKHQERLDREDEREGSNREWQLCRERNNINLSLKSNKWT